MTTERTKQGVRVVGGAVHRGSRRRDQRGLVLVYFALTLTVLLVGAAFSVDVGAWYSRSQKLQRAADAAAMAGVVWMPGDFDRASSVAMDTLASNGITNPSSFNADGSCSTGTCVSISRDPTSDRRLRVNVTDAKVSQYFSQALIKGFSQGRHATAEYIAPIPLGSPENNLGNPDTNCKANHTCMVVPNFVLAINGYCSSAQDGDPIAAAWDGTRSMNVSGGIRTFAGDATQYGEGQTHCPYPGGTGYYEFANKGYNPNGYTYDVDVPGTNGYTTSAYKIEVFDPAYNPPGQANYPASTCDSNNPSYNKATPVPCAPSPPIDRTLSTAAAHITTTFKVLKPDNTPYDNTDNQVLQSTAYPDGGSTTYNDIWSTLYTVPIGSVAGTYKVQVSTGQYETQSWGQNGFALRADVSPFTACVGTSGCAAVHGEGIMSLYVRGSSTTATMYLAKIPSLYAGHTVEITLFDPGEGSNSLQVQNPANNWATFDTSVTDTYSPTVSGLTKVNVLDLNNTVTALPGRYAPFNTANQFDDRTVQLKLNPSPSVTDLTKNDGWWMLQYKAGSTVTDRVTISLRVLAAPVHLVTTNS